MKHVRLALGRSGVGGRFPPPRRRRRRRRCSTSRLGSLTLSFSFSSSPCCFLSSRSCSRSTPIRFAHCFFAGCCSIGVSSSIEATLGPSAASNCYPVRFCYLLGGGQSSSFFVCPWNGAGVGGPSPCGLRGALCQKIVNEDGTTDLVVIAFYSRSLRGPELSYPIQQQEMLVRALCSCKSRQYSTQLAS